ncbi:sugar efflux transporter [Kitasatospora sp. NBC_01539]|uniref:sugar efflux transporter n=1 Tax=Kitasatospora sp. NBC_01539 TaxID=2903577 RepID=UPI0038601D81
MSGIRTVVSSIGPLLRDRALGGLVGATGMIGIGGAMVTTSVSLFLSDEVGVTPLLIGLFFAGRAVMEIVSDLVVGAMSDRIGNRRALLAICSLLSGIGALCFAGLRNYYLLFAAAAVFFGIGSACFSQLFAYTREFADNRAMNPTFFNSALRSVTSLAWIVGPPLGFLLIDVRGFPTLFLTAAALYTAAGALCLWWLPNLRVESGDASAGSPYRGIGGQMLLLMIAVVLLLAVNSIYQINIALFVTKDLGFDAGFTGIMLGTASALEVPVMMYLGSRAERFGKWRLVTAGALCAVVFFSLLPLADEKWMLIVLQLPNAAWTAVVLSIPVTILQDAMADRVGAASALYSSSFKAGIALGGATAGTVAQWAGFTDVFWVCALLSAAAALLLALGRGRGHQGSAGQRDRADVQPGAAAEAHAGVAGTAEPAV